MNPNVIITVKALYDDDHNLKSAVIERGCDIDPRCWKSKKTDTYRVAKILAIGAGRVQCPGENGCELYMHFSPDGHPQDYATPIGPNRFEHAITYIKRDVDPEAICLEKSTPK